LIVQPVGGGAAGSESASATASAGSQTNAGCTASLLVPTETGLVNNFSVFASWPTPLAVLLVNDCGVAVTNGQVAVSFTNGDPPLTLAAVNGTAGLYAATWTPKQSAAQMTISAVATASGFAAATAQISGSVAPNAVPTLTANGTTLPYNSQVGGAVAPGSIIEITGSNLANLPVSATSAPLPAALSGTSVMIGGITAPLFYVTPSQIEAQVPFSLSPSQQYQLVVNANGALTPPQTVQVSAASPALAANGDGSVIAQHWDDGSLVTATNPAVPGEYLVFYLVGMGAVSNPVAEGAATPVNPLSPVTTTPVVKLGGSTVAVLFAGLTPESVGLYQIDIQVPNVSTAGNLLLTVSEGGVISNTTILPVEF
jgi:uncharacterized protein (TIGR03437 family)